MQNYFRYMVTGDPKWNILTANVAARCSKQPKDLRRSGFNQPGSKQVSRPRQQIDYVSRLERSRDFPLEHHCLLPKRTKAMGEAETSKFVQLYMVPGMEHCAGGPGPSAFGQLGIATTNGPKYGVFDALVDWVEKGVPPENVIATKYERMATTRQ